MSMFSVDSARDFLERAGLFYTTRAEVEAMKKDPTATAEDIQDAIDTLQELNMNDVWGWAIAASTKVEDKDLPEVARLFWHYGFCGVLYWAAQQEGIERSEFHDNNRFIEFVKREEKLCEEVPSSSRRAYTKLTYTIGEQDSLFKQITRILMP